MAASSRFATVSEDDFRVEMFFFLFFEIITCVFILKKLFAEGEVIIGEFIARTVFFLSCHQKLRLT